MARKVDPQQPVKAPPKNDGADDLAILCPDVTLTLAGREVTVHEYGFEQGLTVRAKSRELVRDLTAQLRSGEALTEDLLDVLAGHRELLKDLMAQSLAPYPLDGDHEAFERALAFERAWIAKLRHRDGSVLLRVWWGVCGPFFVQQMIWRVEQGAELAAAFAGPTSSTSSSAPDTAAPTSSPDATPSAS